MDHAPGQRQFVNLETYAHYYQRKPKTDRDFKLFCEKRMGLKFSVGGHKLGA